MTINLMFIIVALIFVGFVVLGAVRGLYKTLFKLLSGVLGILASFFIAPLLANFLINYSNLDDIINKQVSSAIEKQVKENIEAQVRKELSESTGISEVNLDTNLVNTAVNTALSSNLTKNQQIDAINGIKLPQFIKKDLIENNYDEVKQKLGVTSFYDYVSTYVTRIIIHVIAFAFTGIILIVVLLLLSTLVAVAVNIPIVDTINSFGGIVLGFAEGLIIVWLLFAIVALGSSTSTGEILYSQISENSILNYLYSKDILINILSSMGKIS